MSRPLLLLVDDAPEMALIVRHLARRAGQDVECLQDARAAGDRLRDGSRPRPDLVLLDLNLPGVGGLEFFRRLRTEPGRPPVALFTQWTSPGSLAEAVDAGIDFIVAKEVLGTPEAWQERLDEVLWLASAPPPGPVEPAPDLAAVLAALRHPALRPCGEEVIQALWRRCLSRAAGESAAAGLPAVDVWASSANVTRSLAPLINSRPGFLANLASALAHQAGCLLGSAPAASVRDALGLPV